MHRCLQVEEILSSIFRNLVEEQDKPEYSRWWLEYGAIDLLDLAVTCKAFTEPALDQLWYRLADFKPLGYCIPKAFRAGETYRLGPGETRFDRLDYYASKVRVYGADNGCVVQNNTHHLFLHALMKARPEHPILFPNLKRLHINLHEFDDFAAIPQALIGPSLELLNVMITRDEFEDTPPTTTTWRNFSTVVTRLGTSLKCFQFTHDQRERYNPPHIYLAPALFTSLQGLACPESLRILEVELTSDALAHLCSNENLHTLEFTVSSDEARKFFSTTPPSSLPRLKNLTLRILDLQAASQLISHMCKPTLRRLKVMQLGISSLNSYNEHWNIHQFLQSLASRSFMANVQALEVVRPDTWTKPEGGVAEIISDSVVPLLSYTQLEVLRLSLCGRAELHREMLVKMAVAWPRLRILDLHEHPRDEIPRITLKDLVSFASACPHLEDVRIRVDATESKYEVADLQKLTPSPALRTLDVCLSPINSRQEKQISQLLVTAFPSLQIFVFGEAHNENDLLNYIQEMTEPEFFSFQCWQRVAEDLKRYRGDIRDLMDL